MLRTQNVTLQRYKRCCSSLYKTNMSSNSTTNFSHINTRFYAKSSKNQSSMPLPSFISDEYSGNIKATGLPFTWGPEEITNFLKQHQLPFEKIIPLVNMSLQNSGESIIKLSNPKHAFHYLSKRIPANTVTKTNKTNEFYGEEYDEEDFEDYDADIKSKRSHTNYAKNRFQNKRELYVKFTTMKQNETTLLATKNNACMRCDAANSNIVHISNLPYTGTETHLSRLSAEYPATKIDCPQVSSNASVGEAYITFDTKIAAHRFVTNVDRTEVAKRILRVRKATPWERRITLSLCQHFQADDPAQRITDEIENLNQLPVLLLAKLPWAAVEEDVRQQVQKVVTGPVKVQLGSMGRKHLPDGNGYVMFSSQDDATSFHEYFTKNPIFPEKEIPTYIHRSWASQMLLSCTPILSMLIAARRIIPDLSPAVLGNKLVNKPVFARGRAIKFSHLPRSTHTADIKRLLKGFQYEKSSIVFGMRPGSTAEHNGMCWVSFANAEEAQQAAEKLNGTEDMGRTLNVTFLAKKTYED